MTRDAATNPQSISLPVIDVRPRSRTSTVVAALTALTLGMVILGGVGFAQSHLFHNAAHDTRHGLNFPCH